MRAGGGSNHRSGLDDGILIKDNHVRLAGGVRRNGQTDEGGAAAKCRSKSRRRVSPMWTTAIDAGADVILLDNLPIDADSPGGRARIAGRAKIEISGGVTLDRMPELATTGADYVSIGALTHSAPAVDLSFEIEPDG